MCEGVGGRGPLRRGASRVLLRLSESNSHKVSGSIRGRMWLNERWPRWYLVNTGRGGRALKGNQRALKGNDRAWETSG